jgi:hypothetical protein
MNFYYHRRQIYSTLAELFTVILKLHGRNLYKTAIVSLVEWKRKVCSLLDLFSCFEKCKKFLEELLSSFLPICIEYLMQSGPHRKHHIQQLLNAL